MTMIPSTRTVRSTVNKTPLLLTLSQPMRSRTHWARTTAKTCRSGVALCGVKANDACTVHYVERLASNDAVVRDSRARKEADQEDAAREEVPLTFIVGKNTVVKGIENAVVGMEVGEVKDVVVAATEAYGDRRDDLTATIPKENCPEGMKVGMTVSLSNGLQAVVTEEDPSGFTIDANHPLAGVEMKYTIEVVENVPSDQVKEVRFVDSHALVFPRSTIIPALYDHSRALRSFPRSTDLMAHSQVYFGAGCFWGPALRFKRIPGVIDTEVGYCNGDVENVTYEDVCSGTTGHNEVVRVMYDSSVVSLRALLEEFFLNAHDPTTLNRQGNDAGTQYRSGAYVNSREDLAIVEAMVEELQPRFGGQIVTEVDLVKLYNVAEEYHQAYLEKGGRFGRKQSAAKKCNDPIRCYG